MDLLYAGKFEALASQALFLEYEDVMGRADQQAVHGFTGERLAGLLSELADRMTPVEIAFRYRPHLRDPDDELVLGAALNGGANAIVTHNVRDFLPESTLYGVSIQTPGRIIQERFRL